MIPLTWSNIPAVGLKLTLTWFIESHQFEDGSVSHSSGSDIYTA